MARKWPFVKLFLTRFSSSIRFFFTTKDNSFRTAIDEACEAFNEMMTELGYTQKFEIYDPTKQQTNPPHQHPLY